MAGVSTLRDLAHDIDNSPEQALALARVEREMGVRSTYFVLLRSEFYNVAARRCLETLGADPRLVGHELGLHFDEKAYPEAGIEETAAHILRERDMLSALLETPVTSVPCTVRLRPRWMRTCRSPV